MPLQAKKAVFTGRDWTQPSFLEKTSDTNALNVCILYLTSYAFCISEKPAVIESLVILIYTHFLLRGKGEYYNSAVNTGDGKMEASFYKKFSFKKYFLKNT